MAGSFLQQIERARAAKSTSAPSEKPVEQMTGAEVDAALVEAKRDVIEANRAVADAMASETSRPDGTLAQHLGRVQRHKRRTWR